MEQYVSWSLSTEELMSWCNLGEIWRILQASVKWSEGKVSSPDKLSDKETGQLMNGTMLSKPKLLWLCIPSKTAKILYRDIFWFFLKEEEFVSKTINDGNIDLDKFPSKQGQTAC